MSASQPTMPQVSIIVLNWNGKDDTANCLDSLARTTYPNFRVTVVDNGSTDGSVEALRRSHPDVEILCTGANLGYAGGNNVGLRACLDDGRSGYVLVLNNDTEVDPTMLDLLVEAARSAPPLAVLGPMIYFKDPAERVWFAGAYWKPEELRFDHVLYRQAGDNRTEPYETDYATGCALFMSIDTMQQVGLFDERFFLVYEEVELCYRIRRLGGRCLVVPRARLWHKVSASFGGASAPLMHYFSARNELLWAEKSLSFREQMRLLANSIAITLLPEVGFKHHPPTPLSKRIYWSILSSSSWDKSLYRDHWYRSRTAGLRDYLMRRFGNCPDSIRDLSRRPARCTSPRQPSC